MGLYNYSHKAPDEKQVARAQVHDVNASYKDLSQVLAAIKAKTVAQATHVLQEVISKKKAIPYKRFAKRLGHRSELAGAKGRYPIKEARIALSLLNNAVANAVNKGLDKNTLYVRAAASHKQNSLMRYRKYWASGIIIGYGRQSYASKYVTCWAEIVLAEKPAAARQAEKKTKGKKAKSEPEKKEKKVEHNIGENVKRE